MTTTYGQILVPSLLVVISFLGKILPVVFLVGVMANVIEMPSVDATAAWSLGMLLSPLVSTTNP